MAFSGFVEVILLNGSLLKSSHLRITWPYTNEAKPAWQHGRFALHCSLNELKKWLLCSAVPVKRLVQALFFRE